ncbi:aromatic compound dioxygenase [Exidia glandulosa HHB12029]|uniref:Aromatic compound dioxygenase n=1 Tax=Exidia glandulosa HHB12029 TaxID=1314781 RepID=A0A165KTX7_EXIGL|nr:aromatic compound dioxygenase [Exidia glandulosa HHB12029]
MSNSNETSALSQPADHASVGLNVVTTDIGELEDYTVTDQVLDLHNTVSKNPRTTAIVNSLVKHAHAFLRETMPTEAEYGIGLDFLNRVLKAGAMQGFEEFFNLTASLGVNTILDELWAPRPKGCTPSTLEGPYFVREKVPVLPSGSSICSPETKGEKVFFSGTIKDTQGNPVKGALVDVWQADGDGLYDVQYPNKVVDDRARITAKDDGSFTFRGVMPIAYSLPGNGPTAELLTALGRRPYRATHIHFHIDAAGYESLTTQIYPSNSIYIGDDSVFATKRALICRIAEDTDVASWKKMGFEESEVTKCGGRVWVWEFDFVLPTPEECEATKLALRKRLAMRV